jgi:hypothetical protein
MAVKTSAALIAEFEIVAQLDPLRYANSERNTTNLSSAIHWRLLPRSNLHSCSLALDALQLIELSFAAARAFFACSLPILWCTQIGVPEWPSAALRRTTLINSAGFRFRQEHTIAVWEFLQALANSYFSYVVMLELVDAHSQLPSDLLDFGIGYPNISGTATAAIPTLSARESQTIPIPRLVMLLVFHSRLQFDTLLVFQPTDVITTLW